jgi:hypothetical protein
LRKIPYLPRVKLAELGRGEKVRSFGKAQFDIESDNRRRRFHPRAVVIVQNFCNETALSKQKQGHARPEWECYG